MFRARPRLASTPPDVSFFTNFSGAPENTISEGGAWHHTSNGWAFIETRTSPNRAVGTQTGNDGFNDSYAYLSGFGPNVSLEATVYKDPTIDTNVGAHEVELLVRMADSSTTARCYEFMWSSVGAYQEIVRWNGDGSFDILTDFGAHTAAVTGDIVKATAIGNQFTAYIKRVGDSGFTQMAQITDNTFSDGQPGMGMWLNSAANIAGQPKFGFTTFSATQLS